MKKVMRKSIVVLLVVAMLISTLGALSFTASAASSLLVQNGSFDDGLYMYTGTAITMEVITEPEHPNNKVLHAIGGGYVRQQVAVEANTDYVFTFRTKKLDQQGAIYVNVFAADGTTNLATAVENLQVPNNNNFAGIHATNGVQFNSSGADWNNIKVYFNSGENTTILISFNLWTTNRDRYFDDLCLYKAPAQGELVNGDFENGMAGYVFLNSGFNKDTISVGYDNTRGSNIINLSTGSDKYSLNGFVLYQNISVKANTDYVWSLMLGTSSGTEQYLGVVAGDTVSTAGNTTIAATATTMTGAVSFAANIHGGGAVNNASGAVDPNWLMFGTNNGWKNVKIEFNSGYNTSICLAYVARAYNRTIAFDDWTLYEKPAVGEIVNGDFEDGLTGIYRDAWISAKVITDPDNAANHILQVGEPTCGTYFNEVSVEKNTKYIWTFRAKSAVAGENTLLYVRPSGDSSTNLITEISKVGSAYTNISGTNAYISTYGDWATINVTFDSGDNTSVRLTHQITVDGRKVYLDDWSLEKAPLPGELRNGDFEDGLKHFVVSNKATAEVSTEDVYDGTYSAKLNGLDGATAYGQTIYQEVIVEPNTDYIWSFWYKSKANNTSLVGVRTADDKNLLPSFLKTNAFSVETDRSFTALRLAGDPNQWHETLYNTEWKKYNVIFNSGDNTTVRLVIDLITSARGGYTDNWSLSEYSFTPGDANNDGTMDVHDLTEIRRALLGMPAYYKGGTNVNGDSDFNILDLIRLKKDLANMVPIAGYSLVWADDFGEQYLDSTKWTRAQHMSAQDDLELRYDETGIAVADGSATLYAGRVDDNNYYTNASLTTCNRDGSTHLMSFKYGYVEMRAKIPFGAPAFPSFWMKSVIDNNMHGEIDIFEHFCYDGDTWIQSGIHKWYLDDNETHMLNNSIGHTNVPADGDWHTYGLLWTPEKLEFKLDGETYHTIDISANWGTYTKYTKDNSEGEEIEADNAIFHDYYYLIMNNYMHTPLSTDGADYAANSSTELPLEYEIDYVRLYQNSDGSIRLGALQ